MLLELFLLQYVIYIDTTNVPWTGDNSKQVGIWILAIHVPIAGFCYFGTSSLSIVSNLPNNAAIRKRRVQTCSWEKYKANDTKNTFVTVTSHNFYCTTVSASTSPSYHGLDFALLEWRMEKREVNVEWAIEAVATSQLYHSIALDHVSPHPTPLTAPVQTPHFNPPTSPPALCGENDLISTVYTHPSFWKEKWRQVHRSSIESAAVDLNRKLALLWNAITTSRSCSRSRVVTV